MKVVNIDPTVMICQSPGGGVDPEGNQPPDPEEGVKMLESALEGIW